MVADGLFHLLEHEPDHRFRSPLDAGVLDHGDARLLGPLDQVCLDAPDVGQRVEVLRDRPQALRARVADPEVPGVLVLVLDREERLDDHRALNGGGNEARHHVHALERHGVALGQRAVDDGADAHKHVPRLVVEADERRVLRLGRGRDRGGRFEARVMDRGHEVDREEGPHRLPHEVRGGDPRDTEAVGDFRRDGRLAGPGSATDQEDQRKIQPLQGAVAPEPTYGILPFVLGEHLGDQLVQMLLGEGLLLVLAHELLLDQPGELVGAHGPEPGPGQRLCHQALRVRKPPAFLLTERLRWSPVAQCCRPGRGQGPEPRVEVAIEGHDFVVGENDLDPLLRRSLGDDVDGRRLQLDEEDLGCPCLL